MAIKVKNFLSNVLIEASLKLGRDFLNEKIKNVTPDDLIEAIKDDKSIIIPENIKKEGIETLKRYSKLFMKFYNEINTELILTWLKEDRPDLYSVIINTPNGIRWIEKEIENIKNMLLKEIK